MNIAICANDTDMIKRISGMLHDLTGRMMVSIKVDCFENGDKLREALCEKIYQMVYVDMEIKTEQVPDLKKIIHGQNPSCFIMFICTDIRCIEDIFFHRPQAYIKNPISHIIFEDFFRRARISMPMCNLPFEYRFQHRKQTMDTSEIVYFESNNKKIKMYLANDQTIEFYGKLDDVETYMVEKLQSESFVRCHKSFYVNNNYILKNTKSHITLLTGEQLPISNAYMK